jgi:hypothetical protein
MNHCSKLSEVKEVDIKTEKVSGHLVRINGSCAPDRTNFYQTCPTVRRTLAKTVSTVFGSTYYNSIQGKHKVRKRQ